MGVALIIGGASGIGAASAQLLAQDGFSIAVADVSREAAAKVADGLPGGKHAAYALDVVRESDVTGTFDEVERDLGAVQVLVVAAGVSGLVNNQRPALRETRTEDWERVMAVNARGPFFCIREILRRREQSPVANGRVVLIASMAAQILSINSPPAYVASKGAVLSLTKVAAGEAAKFGITVNSVAPGAIDTPMLRSVMPKERDAQYFGNSVAGRAGSAVEVANAVRFLASAASSYINGACIDVNGGFAMR